MQRTSSSPLALDFMQATFVGENEMNQLSGSLSIPCLLTKASADSMG